jgi:hypothetical protein
MPEAVKKSFDRVTAKGADDIERFAEKAASDFRSALKRAHDLVDAKAVGRGEVSYEDFLAAASKFLLEVEAPRLRAEEASRGW